jgi:hypothetical protein
MTKTDSRNRILVYEAIRKIFQKVQREDPLNRNAELMLRVLDILCSDQEKISTIIPFRNARELQEAGVPRKIRSAG